MDGVRSEIVVIPPLEFPVTLIVSVPYLTE